MKKIYLLILLFMMVTLGAGLGYQLVHRPPSAIQLPQTVSPQTVDQTISSASATPQISVGKPVTFAIPTINVSAEVEHVGMDSKGRMDVPKKWQNVAWFNLGYRVGQNGNAVIAGHFDRENGDPAVFYDVPKLKTGDKLIVTTDDGKKLTFQITDLKTFDHDKVPLKELFGPSPIPKLNLITCGGTWDEITKNYEKRIVVYSTLFRNN